MSYSTEDEIEILKAAKSGDLNAFEKILFKYERGIFGYIYRMVRQREDAEDLTQDTFVKLYKNRANINLEKNFKSWLYRIATNIVYDRWRKNKKVELILPDSFEELNTISETIGADDAYYYVENREKARDIESALGKIKPIYKTVLLLFYREDSSYQQIAEILELPLGTVKTYLRRAKQDLKRALQENNE